MFIQQILILQLKYQACLQGRIMSLEYMYSDAIWNVKNMFFVFALKLSVSCSNICLREKQERNVKSVAWRQRLVVCRCLCLGSEVGPAGRCCCGSVLEKVNTGEAEQQVPVSCWHSKSNKCPQTANRCSLKKSMHSFQMKAVFKNSSVSFFFFFLKMPCLCLQSDQADGDLPSSSCSQGEKRALCPSGSVIYSLANRRTMFSAQARSRCFPCYNLYRRQLQSIAIFTPQ